MHFTHYFMAFAFSTLVAAQAPCGAPQCDETNGYLCGVCDPEDPQVCIVGGTQHPCMENTIGQGGGSCLSGCFYNNLDTFPNYPYVECC